MKFDEQAVLMRYRLLAIWLVGAFLLGTGLRLLNPEALSVALISLFYFGLMVLPVVCLTLLVLLVGNTVGRMLRYAIQRRGRSQQVLDSHESLNSTLFGYGHVRLVKPSSNGEEPV